MKKLNALLFFVVICSLASTAQLYSVTTPFKSIVKTTNSGIMHEYILITNLSGQVLPMRWIARFGGAVETPSPTVWVYGVADPDSAYAVINDNDSADFNLPLLNNNKIIISAIHNGTPGAYEIDFKIFPISNPSDSTIIGFPIIVTQGGVGVNEFILNSNTLIFPNPTSQKISIITELDPNLIEIADVSGRIVKSFDNFRKEIDVSELKIGDYFIILHTEQGAVTKKFIKQ